MNALRVYHLPPHLSYATKLVSDRFAPVIPAGPVPAFVRDLLALESWDFFDVLHLHTIELATDHEIRALADRLSWERKGFVFTVHDIRPNIETVQEPFLRRTRLALSLATMTTTLTHAAAAELHEALSWTADHPIHVLPHGYAIPPQLAAQVGKLGRSLMVLGALRPNRDVGAVVDAWRHLPTATRPPLHVLLRSVSEADHHRYAPVLAELRQAAAEESGLSVQIRPEFLSVEDLIVSLQQAHALVLPYSRITHSGQLELGRDLGIPVLAPDVPTLRSQIASDRGDEHPCIWYHVQCLRNPVAFAHFLDELSRMTAVDPEHRGRVYAFRSSEHAELLARYDSLYRLACTYRLGEASTAPNPAE